MSDVKEMDQKAIAYDWDQDEIKRRIRIHLWTSCEGHNRLVSTNRIQLLTWCEGHNKRVMWKNIKILTGIESYNRCGRWKKRKGYSNSLGVRAITVEWCGRLYRYWLDQRVITGVRGEKKDKNDTVIDWMWGR